MLILAVGGFARLFLSEPSAQDLPSGVIVLEHVQGVAAERVAVNALCRRTRITLEFLNRQESSGGRMLEVSIDGRAVPEATEQLQSRIGREWISDIGIVNCGYDGADPIILGNITLAGSANIRRSSPNIFFELFRQRGTWQLRLAR